MKLLVDTMGGTTNRVPGVEVVLQATNDRLLDSSTIKLIGALQRRMCTRHQTLIQRRSMQSGSHEAFLDLPAAFAPLEVPTPRVVADLLNGRTWTGRLEAMSAAHDTILAIANSPRDLGTAVVRTRDWRSTEPGILVDGRPVIGAVFDVAVMLSMSVDDFRCGSEPFVFDVPLPEDLDARKLWDELMTLAQDKLGIDRGTVRYSSLVSASPS